ncbi:MAG: hypothetical protein PG981_000072 [Wolbachia endosymbiont of Ctenocephalides orientis wCori]|nr:MAG: hypothetical protein PG981_000072 [Wolbachia endosymbiont of Ctenocephalides orientis wCori]
MVDILGNELASSMDELHMGRLDDNTHMIDELGEKIKESDETSYSIYSKIRDSVIKIPKSNETPEERNHETEGNIHTFQDSSEDRVVSVKHDDAGRTIRKLESGKYEVFKPNGCADFYDSEGRHTGFTC